VHTLFKVNALAGVTAFNALTFGQMLLIHVRFTADYYAIQFWH